MDIQQAVAENIHRIRKAQKLSIDRAAELSGVSKSMWGQIERGLPTPRCRCSAGWPWGCTSPWSS